MDVEASNHCLSPNIHRWQSSFVYCFSAYVQYRVRPLGGIERLSAGWCSLRFALGGTENGSSQNWALERPTRGSSVSDVPVPIFANLPLCKLGSNTVNTHPFQDPGVPSPQAGLALARALAQNTPSAERSQNTSPRRGLANRRF